MPQQDRLTKPAQLARDYICSICCSLMHGFDNNPMLFKPCNHIFCSACDKKIGDRCPICRSIRMGDSTVKVTLRDQIGELDAMCNGNGCETWAKLREIQDHESKCSFCDHCCQYCEGLYPKDTDHEKNCTYKCLHCRKVHLHVDISLEDHEKVCGKKLIPCLSSDVGCPQEVAREDMDAHIETCPFHQIRYFLRMQQLQLEKVTLQMLSTQKTEVLIRKEHLEAIIKHQSLLKKYRNLSQEHVKLMFKAKERATHERDNLILMKKLAEMESKYIRLSEQFLKLGEIHKNLQERLISIDKEILRDGIKSALKPPESDKLDQMLKTFLNDSYLQQQQQHEELLGEYKKFLSMHEVLIEKRFTKLLDKSGEIFLALYSRFLGRKTWGCLNIESIRDDDLQFLWEYQQLMTKQVSSVNDMFSGFVIQHSAMQDGHLKKFGSFFGLMDVCHVAPSNISGCEVVSSGFSLVAPNVLRRHKIEDLKRKIKLLEEFRDRACPISAVAMCDAPSEAVAIKSDEGFNTQGRLNVLQKDGKCDVEGQNSSIDLALEFKANMSVMLELPPVSAFEEDVRFFEGHGATRSINYEMEEKELVVNRKQEGSVRAEREVQQVEEGEEVD